MARYIDADYFKKRLVLWADNPEKGAFAKVFAEMFCDVIDEVPTADVVPNHEHDQALQDKARECNIAIDKICLEHREEIRALQEKHEAELAKAKRDIARKVIAEVDLLISKYHLEPYYSVNDMEIDIAELRKKFTKGATDGKADCENGGIDV